MNEEWTHQWSDKLGDEMENIRGFGHINYLETLALYAQDAQQIEQYKAEIRAKRAVVRGGLVGPQSQVPQESARQSYVPQQRQAPAQEQYVPQNNAPAGPVPTCIHGPKKWLTGVSKNTGKEYAFWACQGPRGEQCR